MIHDHGEMVRERESVDSTLESIRVLLQPPPFLVGAGSGGWMEELIHWCVDMNNGWRK